MKKATIHVNEASKIVNMSVAGQMTMEDAKLFVEEYVAKIGPINGPDYDLFVDCTEMKLLSQELSDNLTEVMKMYKETGFKKVIYTIKENVVLKMQLARVARNAGLLQASVEEA
ncbi:hypothetical protein MKX67_17400 [Cytobacillus sp. FSL W7-1323]|uniref:STAS domain-containing protein n=1 Tax=Cytobacillus kochii TaxID=859143 RepID=A0A248TKE8_9BACI|nr:MULTISPECIES: hypothetical protein [Cytobacillus]ASV68686.1 hypothetical protein CKF48_16180 [Cytobacillus kochii]MCA1025149.1 hypothetical protein [Cytobacillus kochii]MCM3323058.1 hypothetical protein [Cytobacillus kochii]MCM3345453.1 hypothetical protein [Cytobacillus kochii]MDM5208808.1 hypothetical protein [Cytobacillus kochii]